MAKYENIENIVKMLTDGSIGELSKKVSAIEKTAFEIVKKLNELNSVRLAKLAEEKAVQEAVSVPDAPVAESAPAEEVKAETQEQASLPEEQITQTEEEKSAEKPKKAAKPEKSKKTEADNSLSSVKIIEEQKPKPKEEKSARPSFIVSKASAQPKTFINRDAGRGERPARQSFTQQTRAAGGAKSAQGGAKYVAPGAIQPAKPTGKNFGADKKKGFEKTYIEKDRHQISKRALAKQQGVSVSDFDEDKSGYRKLRVKKDKKQTSSQTVKIEHAVVTTNDIPLKVLSDKRG